MKQKTLSIILVLTFLVLSLNFISAVVVDAEYVTLFPGEPGMVEVEIDNNLNFDIEDVSVALSLDSVDFTSVGSSERDIDDLDEDDDDTVTFTILASSDITPGDYNIPYVVKFTNAENNSATQEEKEGNFGIRVSARTELDFAAEVNENAIVGQQGRISLEVINKGLGDIKSVSVTIFPSGFELLSKEKIFIGTVNSDDTDIASFDVVYKSGSPSLSAKVEYKDFDNNEQIQTVNLPLNIYTQEEALELGLVQKNQTGLYVGGVVVLIIAWIVYRRIKKRRKNKK